MAEMTPIDIRIDEDAIKKQVESAITDALRGTSMKLRVAADALDPDFLKYQDEWVEQEVERRVDLKLKEASDG